MHRKTKQARMLMVSSFKLIGVALVSSVLISAGPPAGVGYLPRVGPGMLRFKAEVHANPAVLLPPLKMNDDEEPKDARSSAPEQSHAISLQTEGIRNPKDETHDLPGDLAMSPGEIRNPQEPSAIQPDQAIGQSIIAPQ